MLYVCHTCEVQRHEQCIVILDPLATCSCEEVNHQLAIHPELTGHLAQRSLPKRGEMREIDYELEPFEQFGPYDRKSALKYGKPAEDLEDSRSIRRSIDWRNDLRRRYEEGDF